MSYTFGTAADCAAGCNSMLMCNQTVTLVRLEYDEKQDTERYACTVLEGVSWYGAKRIAKDANGRKAANEYRVRIPAATADDAGITPERGDILVLGAVASVSCIKDVSAYTGFVVQIVSDNRRGRFQHWAVSGE